MSVADRYFRSTLHRAAAANAIPLAFLRSHTHPVLPGELRGRLDAFQHDLDRYNADIKAVRAALKRLKRERAALAGATASWAAVFAPIRKLPNELLLRILHHAVDNTPRTLYEGYAPPVDDADDIEYMEDNFWPMEMLSQASWRKLGAVCRHWRDVVEGTPSIWANINAIGLISYHNDCAGEVLRQALARTRGIPLHIGLGIKVSGLQDIFAMLMEHAERWKKLTLRADVDELAELQAIAGRLPLLESLDVQIPGHRYYNPWMPTKWTLFEDVPSLRRLVFNNKPPPVPWAQLTHVHLRSKGAVYDNLAFLEKCSPRCSVKISHLAEDNLEIDSRGRSAIQADIPSLHLCMIGICGDASVPAPEELLGPVLSFLDLPRLTSLTLERQQDKYTPFKGMVSEVLWNADAFAAFVRRSPHVTVLHLHGISIDARQLCAGLRLMPLLETLGLALPGFRPRVCYH
ncbi:F-box domain-containing protein [Mycena indigotica]|uniref:F-box domain-containing protein n=1 Tax=Mycena indigotica TaxID=2126181 RepID=A0A8H6W070_9AGAR|nr:F-box domain-containing protein [Mycena indigotica]KAF7296763.1 F-box domain-containing protein [Mycena indigotica]